MQEMAAHELYVRVCSRRRVPVLTRMCGRRYKHNWRYHKELRLWLTKEAGTEPIQKTATYERGTYMCVDACPSLACRARPRGAPCSVPAPWCASGRSVRTRTLRAFLPRSAPRAAGRWPQVEAAMRPRCLAPVKALQTALNLCMEARLVLETPLMWIDKAETWRMAHDLGGMPLVDLVVRDTHTCYLGDRATRHDWGAGCGTCDACRLRAAGWAKWRASPAP